MVRAWRQPQACLLALLMIISLLLRIVLLANEGQLRFPDEFRYLRSTDAAQQIVELDGAALLSSLLGHADHPGFTAVGLIPALTHRLIYELAPASEFTWLVYWQGGAQDYRVSAALFALPSGLCIGILYAVARAMGGSKREGLLAACLLASANTFFMYSQHFLPYDCAMLFGLTALWTAVRPGRADARRSLLVGALTFCAFWIWSGFLSFCLMLAALYSLYLARSLRDGWQRAVGMAVGALTLLLPILAAAYWLIDYDLLAEMVKFGGTVNQGDISEGYAVPWLYFAAAEGGIALLWLCGGALALWRIMRSPRGAARRRGLLWLLGLTTIYALLVSFSNGLQWYVVYGRVARGMAPFMVLLCAFGFAPLLSSARRQTAFAAAVCLLAGFNFAPIIGQQHYRVIQRQVYDNYEYEDVSFESTYGANAVCFGVCQRQWPDARYKLLNAGEFYPIAEIHERPPGKVLREIPHFNSVRAWQFENMTASTRQLFNTREVKIWLIDTGSEEP